MLAESLFLSLYLSINKEEFDPGQRLQVSPVICKKGTTPNSVVGQIALEMKHRIHEAYHRQSPLRQHERGRRGSQVSQWSLERCIPKIRKQGVAKRGDLGARIVNFCVERFCKNIFTVRSEGDF